MAQLNDRYAELFELPSSEDAKKEETDGGGEKDVDGDSGGDQGYSWMALVDIVSETLRIGWHEVYDISVIEFLNIAAYRKEKARKEQEALKKWKVSN